MGKKKRIRANEPASPAAKVIVPSKVIDNGPWYTKFSFQAGLLVIIGLLCFANSFKNIYALDDDAIIVKNQYVQEGFKGIPAILSSDAQASLYQQWGAGQILSGGRYRPLSIVTFAMEQQFFGSVNDNDTASLLIIKPMTEKQKARIEQVAHIRHAGNVIFYILSVLLLLYFLRDYVFIEQPLIAFLTSLLFLIHPIHTEVVANVKSRDEIFSFLFFMLTFIQAFRYYETADKKHLWLSLLYYFMALLSKEYGLTILVLLPMLFYIVKKDTLTKSIVRTLPFFVVAIVYVFIRLSIVGLGSNAGSTDILNNPYMLASDIETLATKILVLGKYLWLLFYPAVLSNDYGYNTIPYADFSDVRVWLSLAILIGMIVATIILFRKRNIISFALAFYLLHLFLVSNFAFDLGATMGERLIYHSSLGFVMILAIGFNFLLEKIKQPVAKGAVLVSVCLLLVGWCAAKDIQRNAEWKDDTTLPLADVQKYPNSAFLNNNAANALIDSALNAGDSAKKVEFAGRSIPYLQQAVTIHPAFATAYLNLGFAYFLTGNLDSAQKYYDHVKAIFPTYPYLESHYQQLAGVYNTMAIGYETTNQLLTAKYFEKALACEPNNVDYINNTAVGYYYITHEPEKAKQLWERSLQLQPGNQSAVNGLAKIANDKK